MSAAERRDGAAASPAVDVSVVIPAHDAASMIADAIASILHGTRRPREIIVVDDRCTDGTGAIAAALDPCVRVVGSEGPGPARARNSGARRARGEWLAFLDADDLWEPARLELGLAAAASAVPDAAIHGWIRQFFDPSLGRSDLPSPAISRACHPDTLLVRRDAFLASGGYDARTEVAEVVEWWARWRDAGRAVVEIPTVLAARRIHGGNLGMRHEAPALEYVRLAKSLLDRRRAADGRP